MKVTLKKPWRSPRGKLYPIGTVFMRRNIESYPSMGSSWYDFNTPNGSYGIVLISDSILTIPSEDEKTARAARKKMIDRHIEATKDPFR